MPLAVRPPVVAVVGRRRRRESSRTRSPAAAPRGALRGSDDRHRRDSRAPSARGAPSSEDGRVSAWVARRAVRPDGPGARERIRLPASPGRTPRARCSRLTEPAHAQCVTRLAPPRPRERQRADRRPALAPGLGLRSRAPGPETESFPPDSTFCCDPESSRSRPARVRGELGWAPAPAVSDSSFTLGEPQGHGERVPPKTAPCPGATRKRRRESLRKRGRPRRGVRPELGADGSARWGRRPHPEEQFRAGGVRAPPFLGVLPAEAYVARGPARGTGAEVGGAVEPFASPS